MALISNNRNHQMTQITPQQILELKQTMTTRQLAQHLNISYSKARYWLNRYRLKGMPIPRQKAGRKPTIL